MGEEEPQSRIEICLHLLCCPPRLAGGVRMVWQLLGQGCYNSRQLVL